MTPAEDARLLLKAVLVLIQDLEACGETIPLVPELLALDESAVVARYDADPTPLPADRARLLTLLDALHQELIRRVD